MSTARIFSGVVATYRCLVVGAIIFSVGVLAGSYLVTVDRRSWVLMERAGNVATLSELCLALVGCGLYFGCVAHGVEPPHGLGQAAVLSLLACLVLVFCLPVIAVP